MHDLSADLLPSSTPPVVRIYAVRAFDAMASATISFAVPLLVLISTGSARMTGLAFLLEWAPRLGAFTIAGTLVERWGAVRVIRIVNLCRTVCLMVSGVAFTFLPTTGAAPVSVTLVFGTISGVLAEFTYVAMETLGVQAGREYSVRTHRIQAVNTGIDQVALIIGPLFVGVILPQSAPTLLYAVAGFALAASVATSRMRAPAAPAESGVSDIHAGFGAVLRTPALLWLLVGFMASNLSTAVLQAATPALLLVQRHSSPAAVGALWTAAAIASLLAVGIARPAIGRWSVRGVGAAAAASSTLACLLIPVLPGILGYTLAAVAFMAADGALTVVLRTLRSRLLPIKGFSSALSASVLIVLLPMPAAGILVSVVPAHSLTALFPACAVLQGIFLYYCFRPATGGCRRRIGTGALPPAIDPATPEAAHTTLS